MRGVDPRRAVAQAVERPSLSRFLKDARRVGVFACGKAAAPMVRGLPGRLRRNALVVLPRGFPAEGLSGARILFSSHPEPAASSVEAARQALDYFSGFGAGDVILCLISGGTSSLPTKKSLAFTKTRGQTGISGVGALVA